MVLYGIHGEWKNHGGGGGRPIASERRGRDQKQHPYVLDRKCLVFSRGALYKQEDPVLFL